MPKTKTRMELWGEIKAPIHRHDRSRSSVVLVQRAELCTNPREMAEVLGVTGRVKISGATGPEADKINGVFVLSSEVVNEAAAYQKEGDPDRWLARTTNGRWIVQDTEDR